MDKRQWGICTLIHHIATAAGLVLGILGLFSDRKGRKKRSVLKQGLLIGYMMIQGWAVLKIMVTLIAKKEYMKKSRENLHKICKEEQKEKRYVWGLTGLSVGFKIGVPLMLRQ